MGRRKPLKHKRSPLRAAQKFTLANQQTLALISGKAPRFVLYRDDEGRLVMADDYSYFILAKKVGLLEVDADILNEGDDYRPYRPVITVVRRFVG